MHEAGLEQALADEPWHASAWYQRQRHRDTAVELTVLVETTDGSGDVLRDQPVTFAADRRAHALRTIATTSVTVPNPLTSPAHACAPARPGQPPASGERLMYLTRFRVNTARPGSRRLLSSPSGYARRRHVVLPHLLPTGQDTPRILWRIDHNARAEIVLYVLSPDRPDLTHLVEQAGLARRGRERHHRHSPPRMAQLRLHAVPRTPHHRLHLGLPPHRQPRPPHSTQRRRTAKSVPPTSPPDTRCSGSSTAKSEQASAS